MSGTGLGSFAMPGTFSGLMRCPVLTYGAAFLCNARDWHREGAIGLCEPPVGRSSTSRSLSVRASRQEEATIRAGGGGAWCGRRGRWWCEREMSAGGRWEEEEEEERGDGGGS
eukprot:3724548-Rhodomonas_salina.1